MISVTCSFLDVFPNKVFPKPAFTTIEELQRMSVREIVCGSVGKFGSTSGTEICQVIKHVCMFFFGWHELVKDLPGPNPPPPSWVCLSDFRSIFSALNWKNDLAKGICPMNEFPCKGFKHNSIAGAGQKQYVLRRVREWCTFIKYPYAPQLLQVITDERFIDVIELLRKEWSQIASSAEFKECRKRKKTVDF